MRVSSIYVRGLLEAVEMTGARSARLLEDAGVTLDANVYGWVALADFERVAELAIARTNEPALGLRWGAESPMMRFDLFTLMGSAHAPTLRGTLAHLMRFQTLLGERPELSMSEDGTHARLWFELEGVSETAKRLRTEVAVTGLTRFLKYASVDGDDGVRHVDFAYPRPSYGAEYDRFFGDTLRFDRPRTEIALDRTCLDRVLPNANPELHTVLVAQAEQVIARVTQELSHAARIRNLLSNAFPNVPEMPEVARALGMSERSLRRRLSEEGTSYSRIAQEARCIVAQRLLRHPSRTLQEVAFEAGFESASAFHRAFRRWTGMSPLEFRATRPA